MRQILLLPLAALLAMPVFSQTPADTTLTIRNIEIQGTRFAGLSERGGMKILRVNNNCRDACRWSSLRFAGRI